MAEFEDLKPSAAPATTPPAESYAPEGYVAPPISSSLPPSKPLPSTIQTSQPVITPQKTITTHDFPKAKGRAVVKDPTSGIVYPADSTKGKALVENGWAEIEFIDESADDTFFQQGLTPIKTMQQALINLSKDIASHNIHSVEERQNTKGEILTGSDSFMNFIVNNYVNKANPTGKQFITTDTKQPTRMDTAKESDNFKGILHTISRIGTPGKEQQPDGIWGSRTNNALKQIYSIAYALMNVLHDMNIEISGYSDADLTELHNNIPPDIEHISLNEKVQKANVIAKNLDKFRALYDNFREKILNNPTYRAHIAQEKPLMVNAPKLQKTITFTDKDRDLYEQHKSVKIDITLNGHKTTIMPYNLINIDTFKKFLISKRDALTPQDLDGINKNDKLTINKFLIEVANELEKE